MTPLEKARHAALMCMVWLTDEGKTASARILDELIRAAKEEGRAEVRAALKHQQEELLRVVRECWSALEGAGVQTGGRSIAACVDVLRAERDELRARLKVAEDALGLGLITLPAYVRELGADAALDGMSICANAWDPRVRLVGNVQAGDIVAAIDELRAKVAEAQAQLAARDVVPAAALRELVEEYDRAPWHDLASAGIVLVGALSRLLPRLDDAFIARTYGAPREPTARERLGRWLAAEPGRSWSNHSGNSPMPIVTLLRGVLESGSSVVSGGRPTEDAAIADALSKLPEGT